MKVLVISRDGAACTAMKLSQNPVRVLLVDDEEIVRYGLKAIAQGSPDIEVIGEAGNGEEAIAQAQTLQPDVILMDISMPGVDGVAATQQIRQAQPDAKILILTTHDEPQYLIEAIQQGAAGYLLKNTPPSDFVQSIRQAHKGYMQIGPGLGQLLCQQLKAPSHQPQIEKLKHVTPREQDVLQLVAEGASNREIANRLHITEKTVKNHVSSILSQVGVRSRTQLAIWANSTERSSQLISA